MIATCGPDAWHEAQDVALAYSGWATLLNKTAYSRVELQGTGIIALVDGLGGHPGGRTAAAIVATHLLCLGGRNSISMSRIKDVILDAHIDCNRISLLRGWSKPCGAVVAGFYWNRQELVGFGVGDCQMTRDAEEHSLLPIDRRPDGRLTNSVGGSKSEDPVVHTFSAKPAFYALSTDGLWEAGSALNMRVREAAAKGDCDSVLDELRLARTLSGDDASFACLNL